MDNIKTDFMKAIFLCESDEATNFLRKERATTFWTKEYEQSLLVAFWLAVDKQQIELASSLMDFDISIRHIVTIAFKLSDKGKPVPEFRVKPVDEPIIQTAEKEPLTVAGSG